jgi:mannose-1-phosphate guanylyltransferase
MATGLVATGWLGRPVVDVPTTRGCRGTNRAVRPSRFVLILAGGGGTRLWPQSRRRRPKQVLPLLPDGRTLLQATVDRVRPIVPLSHLLVVTAADQIEVIRQAVPSLPIENIVIEPRARNTAACVGLGAVAALGRGGRASCAVLPSDQHIADDERFRTCLEVAFQRAESAGHPVVTVGVRPTSPETGFGYLEPGAATASGAHVVARFVEKPDRATAERYVASGFLWNAGMFVFDAERMLQAIGTHLPQLGAILDELRRDPARTEALYPEAQSISIDYGVMEKLGPGEVETVPGDFGWNDVGSFSALHAIAPTDAAGNATLGEAVTIDARNNILCGDGRRVIAAVGVEDLIIVATDDAVLVMPRGRAQDVRQVVEQLERTGRGSYL